eukprot:4100816-Heterocapsa_arctica.AAC.1
MDEQNKKYRFLRDQHNFDDMPGACHHYVWGAMVLAIITCCTSKEVNSTYPDLQQDIKQLQDHISATPNVLRLEDVVHVCRADSAHQQDTAYITISVAPELHAMEIAALRLLRQLGATLLHGSPPKGPQERKVEAALKRAGALSA